MYFRIQKSKPLFEILVPYIKQKFKHGFAIQTSNRHSSSSSSSMGRPSFCTETNPNLNSSTYSEQSPIHDSWEGNDENPDNSTIAKHSSIIQNLLKLHSNSSVQKLEQALENCGFSINDDLVLNVLKRYRSDSKPAFIFFNWVCRRKGNDDYRPGSLVYNEMLDILGRMKQFEQLEKVFDEMSKRKKNLVNERTYAILVNRYASAHRTEETIQIFHKRRELGFGFDFELDFEAFQTLLLSLCRYKHVETAETLFLSLKHEFPPSIKTWNIILNGWCVLGSLYEAKRVWNDIILSNCKPDLFTYGIYMNSLTKAGKLGTALKLFKAMKERLCKPDVVIYNCIIDSLCFKKRIPEALQVFKEMNEKDCPPNTATYNSLIKHLCKIRRMEKVYELLDEMEKKKGCCLPNDITYNYLLKSMKEPEEVPGILGRMKKNGCEITEDTYNLILKLFMDWDNQDGVESMWVEMERNGLGPDRRSYIIMVHGLHGYGRFEEALRYYSEMIAKEMMPEPRTELLVASMNMELKERNEGGRKEATMGSSKIKDSSLHLKKKRRRMRKGVLSDEGENV